MRYTLRALIKWAAPGLAVCALATATAAAQPSQNLRSPDARDPGPQAQSVRDLRSPDTRDAAQGRGTSRAPRTVVVSVSRPQVSGSGGFDWGDASIGAGAVFGLVLIGAGGTLVVTHRGRTGAKRSGRAATALRTMTDQLEVTLNVPDLRQAARFYRALLGSPPVTAERRVAWFDVPGSELRLAVRESATPSATRLRVCVDPGRLRAASRRLREIGARPSGSGLASDGHPRAIALSDPGGNGLELCSPLALAPPARWRQIDARRLMRSGARLLGRALGPGTIGQRLDQARAHDQLMTLGLGRR
jgi:catechol 2,3-dioxygenase-like lactoylglutathione lyase family enzyme